MKLRNHPLKSCGGLRNWPPTWSWIGGENKSHPAGEVGVLTEVKTYYPTGQTFGLPLNRIFLFIDYDKSRYVGSMSFEDAEACKTVAEILQRYCGHDLAEIGDIELRFLDKTAAPTSPVKSQASLWRRVVEFSGQALRRAS
ncbi:MAG TPA: hypothetical protein VI231_19670 [Candidatus Binatia bacterium]|jgi:hypothetical protein